MGVRVQRFLDVDPTNPLIRYSRLAFVVSAWAYAASVVWQVFLAGLSVFDNPARWVDHASTGQMVGTLTIFMVLFALIGRLPIIVIGLSVLVLLLYGMQYPFANTNAGWLAALHAVNALVMFWLATHLAGRVTAILRMSSGERARR